MNKSDIPRMQRAMRASLEVIDAHAAPMFAATHDWQYSLSAGASGPQGKGGHGDPTVNSVLYPDPLALEHNLLVAELEAADRALEAVASRLRRLAPIDPNKVQRGRVSEVPACIVCTGPAVPCRRGMCDACRKAYDRAGKGDLMAFTKARLLSLAPPPKEYAS